MKTLMTLHICLGMVVYWAAASCAADVTPTLLKEIGAIVVRDHQSGNVVSVRIHDARISEDIADEIASFSSLRSLVLYDCTLNDNILKKWRHLDSIVELRLAGSYLIIKPAETIGGLRKLEILDLGRSPVFRFQGGNFLKELKNLKEFRVPDSSFKDRHITPLLNCTKLERLDLSQAEIASSRSLASFEAFEQLRFLALPHTFDDDDLEGISKLKQITYLDLTATRVKGTGFRYLTSLSLTSLELPATPPSALFEDSDDSVSNEEEFFPNENGPGFDIGLEHLCKLKSLRRLILNGYRLSRRGRSQLQNSLPACKIIDKPF